MPLILRLIAGFRYSKSTGTKQGSNQKNAHDKPGFKGYISLYPPKEEFRVNSRGSIFCGVANPVQRENLRRNT